MKVIDELRGHYGFTRFSLWGRSMGAVTAILFAEMNNFHPTAHISSLVLDSPFTDINSLAQDVADQHHNIPAMFVTMAMSVVKSTIRQKLKFEIDDLKPTQSI